MAVKNILIMINILKTVFIREILMVLVDLLARQWYLIGMKTHIVLIIKSKPQIINSPHHITVQEVRYLLKREHYRLKPTD